MSNNENGRQLATNGGCLYSLVALSSGASNNMVDFQNPMGTWVQTTWEAIRSAKAKVARKPRARHTDDGDG